MTRIGILGHGAAALQLAAIAAAAALPPGVELVPIDDPIKPSEPLDLKPTAADLPPPLPPDERAMQRDLRDRRRRWGELSEADIAAIAAAQAKRTRKNAKRAGRTA